MSIDCEGWAELLLESLPDEEFLGVVVLPVDGEPVIRILAGGEELLEAGEGEVVGEHETGWDADDPGALDQADELADEMVTALLQVGFRSRRYDW